MLTVGEIKDILKRERLSISKRRGQNFLICERMQNKIINAVGVGPTDEILEIGPGFGALTEDLASQAAKVIAVEKDKAFARILGQRLLNYKQLQIIHQDILNFDIEKYTNKKVKVVGNLPYYISTPIITYLLEEKRKVIKDIFITVQYEVGRRLAAEKGSKDYSALSILVQYFTKPELLFSIPKRAFYPQPKVDSVFVHLHILQQPCVKVNNRQQFFKIVRTCFNQRRKIILNSLAGKLSKKIAYPYTLTGTSGHKFDDDSMRFSQWYPTHTFLYHKIEKDMLQKILKDQGIDVQARPEELSLDEFAQVEDAFYKRRMRLE